MFDDQDITKVQLLIQLKLSNQQNLIVIQQNFSSEQNCSWQDSVSDGRGHGGHYRLHGQEGHIFAGRICNRFVTPRTRIAGQVSFVLAGHVWLHHRTCPGRTEIEVMLEQPFLATILTTRQTYKEIVDVYAKCQDDGACLCDLEAQLHIRTRHLDATFL